MRMDMGHGTWGERLRTFEWSGGIVTLLFLQPLQECSYHKHLTAYNKFTCISGSVMIESEKGYTTTLLPKQTFTTEPGVMHKFITGKEPAVVEEIAYVKYNEHDIHREKLGGPVNG